MINFYHYQQIFDINEMRRNDLCYSLKKLYN